MKIGIDFSPAVREQKTGVEWYVTHCVRELIQLSNDHSFVLYSDKEVPSNLFLRTSFLQNKKLTWPFPLFWSEARLSAEMLHMPPDVLFIPGRGIPLIHPNRTVSTVHDLGFYDYASYRPQKTIAYLKWSTHFVISQASQIITISEFTKQEVMRRFSISESKIHVTHLSHDERIFNESYSDEEVKQCVSHYSLKGPYLLTVGRIDDRKNILNLVSAFEKIYRTYPMQLVIVGPYGFQGKEIQKKWESKDISHAITYLSWVGEREKALLIRGASCFVFPSLYEGFGIPILEAQGCGTPVLCSQTTSLPEVAGEGALFFNPHSSDDIADKIEYCVSHPQEMTELIERGRQNARRYSWKKTALKTLDILTYMA